MAEIAALINGDGNAFEHLLQLLMSTENQQRSHAEKVFADLKNNPDACVSHLIRGLRSSPALESRALCAVLLRKVGG